MYHTNNKCICGRFCASECIFNVCKRCCCSKICLKHNPLLNENKQDTEIKQTTKQCCICLKSENEIVLDSTINKNNANIIYHCKNCYLNNEKLFNNIIETQNTIDNIMETQDIIDNIMETQDTTNYIFQVDDVHNCSCGQIPALNCILRSCKNCCIVKECPRHKTGKKIMNNSNVVNVGNIGNIGNMGNVEDVDNVEGVRDMEHQIVQCMICKKSSEKSLIDEFFNKKVQKTIRYCDTCYKKHTQIFNNLINNSSVDKTKLNIKYIQTPDLTTSYSRKKFEKEQCDQMMNSILEKCENKIIVWDIFNNELKKIKGFDLNEIPNDYQYKCPECQETTVFCDISICRTCKKIICDDCVKIKYYHSDLERFCSDCYIDTYGNFYKKYKDTILTAEILKNDDNFDLEEFSLYDFDQEGYKLKYKCPICTVDNDFSNNAISSCDKCNTLICDECNIVKYIECGYYNCRYCINRTCYNSTDKIYCLKCVEEYQISLSSDEDSEIEYSDDNDSYNDSDDEDSDNVKIVINKKRCSSPCELATEPNTECNICYINKKKYACVPCGHLCMCGECANRIIDTCPMCKTKISTIIKIYS